MKETNNLYNINKKIIYKVIIFHFIFILFLSFQFKSFKKNKKQNIIVNNIIETPLPKELSLSKESFQLNQTLQSKEPIPKEKIIEKHPTKKIDKPKVIPQKKTSTSTVKKTEVKKIAQKPISKKTTYETLITTLEKQINEIDTSQEIDNSQIEISDQKDLLIPKNIKTLNIDKIIENAQNQPSKINELLIKELQENLNLPEYGEVKVSFTILPSGEIKDVVILEYKSNENQKYLKNSLCELSFKSIKKMFDEPQKFIVIFKNE